MLVTGFDCGQGRSTFSIAVSVFSLHPPFHLLYRLLAGNEMGKPTARSGRKAMGLSEIARLPN
jgi:hypothetical protein